MTLRARIGCYLAVLLADAAAIRIVGLDPLAAMTIGVGAYLLLIFPAIR